MAEQKKANEALNVEEALSQSEAFLIKNKKAIMLNRAKKKHRLHCSKDRNTLRLTFTNRH